MESQAVCRFEVVKDKLMLYTWTLDGSAEEPENPDSPEDPDGPEEPEDPAFPTVPESISPPALQKRSWQSRSGKRKSP